MQTTLSLNLYVAFSVHNICSKLWSNSALTKKKSILVPNFFPYLKKYYDLVLKP